MKPKKIMIVFFDMALGGIQRKILDIINHLHNHYSNIQITLCLIEKKGIFIDRIPDYVKIKKPPFRTPILYLPWFTLWITKEIISNKPDYILPFMDVSAVAVLAAKQLLFWKKPLVCIGEDILTSKYLLTESQPDLRRKMIRYFYPKSDKILVQTPVQKADLIDIVGQNIADKIIVSPNWLPLEFPPQKLPPRSDRSIDILYLGRFDSQKNLSLFITIISQLQHSIPRLKAVLVGSGHETRKLKRLTKHLGLSKNIQFFPATTDPTSFYTQSKIFLLTSDYEGFPLTLLEAISCGCIPISRNLSEIKQFFNQDSKHYLFSNPDEAAVLLNYTLTHPPKPSLKLYYQRILTLQNKYLHLYVKHLLFKK